MGREPLLLLTNDDGIDAPGLAALRESVLGLGDVEIVAVTARFPNPKVTEPGDLDLVRLLLEESS